jgi:valyl-tRNA synthetase
MDRFFESHRYHEAADIFWTFFWDQFCDLYLELKKADTDWGYASKIHEKALLLLHPLMPFISEELWHRTGHETSIALEPYPQYDPVASDPGAERHMRALVNILTGIRERRAEQKIDKKRELTIFARASDEWFKLILDNASAIQRIENVKLEVENGLPDQKHAGLANGSGSQVIWGVLFEAQNICMLGFEIPVVMGLSGEQKDRLRKDSEQLEKVIANSKRQLANESFVAKAPAHVIDVMRAKLAEYEAQLAKNRAALGE